MKSAARAGRLLALLTISVLFAMPAAALAGDDSHGGAGSRGGEPGDTNDHGMSSPRSDDSDRGRLYGYFGSPFYYPYGWYGFNGPFYPGYYDPLYGPYGGGAGNWTSVRIEVKPNDAQVYVDGYYAGTVDQYDGIFQRLELTPGNHEIEVYLKGYRTITRQMYANPGGSYRIQQDMVPLAPGQAQAPPPSPPKSTKSGEATSHG